MAIVRCEARKNCKARRHCVHAKRHEEKTYKRNDFLTTKCTEIFMCPYQNVMVRCRGYKEVTNNEM